MNTTLLKKLSIGGGYGLALLCCLLAFPSYKAQTEETISQTLDSVDRALNDPNAPAEIAIAASPARYPLAGFLVRASVGFALLGTGGTVWTLFGKAEQHQPTPPFLLPPAASNSAPSLPYPLSSSPTPPVSPSPHHPITPTPTKYGDFEQRRAHLFQSLANSPQAWILQLLEATPVLIWGEQQSGKTELAQIIALLRMVFLFHAVEVADPHGHINEWLPCFPVFGSEFDYDAIDARLVAYRERLKSSPHAKQPITTIWDEFTQYAENCTCQKTKEFDFIKSIIAESQKKDEFPIAISHGRTQTAKGGTTGTDEMFENGFIQIHLLAQRNATGRAMPSGRGFLKGLTKDANGKPEQIAIALPSWLRAAALYQYFPEINNPALSTLPERAPQSGSLRDRPFPSPSAASSATPSYANLAQHLDNLMDSETIAPHLAAILKFALVQGEPVKARDIQRASATAHPDLDAETIRLLRSLKADVIQSAFQELAALGKGHCQEEGSSLLFVPGREE
ncbi:hypothetical protein [Oscillatoria sp. FACHB-1406]|uniref:hypothetical protein n=1 Tax=Oscillatoria sp. FACHB-1406 TaxID=2692846 RepID=UPI0016887668|nr:hypothetical protein [Oscillatoria sp. FACHB-1406]MBD2580150.1 hypothetical protein [Oscillatoria sp. FACHB-1406]